MPLDNNKTLIWPRIKTTYKKINFKRERRKIRVYLRCKNAAAPTRLALILLPHLLSLNDLGPVLHSVGLRCELLGHVAVVNVVVGKVLHVVTQGGAVTWARTHTHRVSQLL